MGGDGKSNPLAKGAGLVRKVGPGKKAGSNVVSPSRLPEFDQRDQSDDGDSIVVELDREEAHADVEHAEGSKKGKDGGRRPPLPRVPKFGGKRDHEGDENDPAKENANGGDDNSRHEKHSKPGRVIGRVLKKNKDKDAPLSPDGTDEDVDAEFADDAEFSTGNQFTTGNHNGTAGAGKRKQGALKNILTKKPSADKEVPASARTSADDVEEVGMDDESNHAANEGPDKGRGGLRGRFGRKESKGEEEEGHVEEGLKDREPTERDNREGRHVGQGLRNRLKKESKNDPNNPISPSIAELEEADATDIEYDGAENPDRSRREEKIRELGRLLKKLITDEESDDGEDHLGEDDTKNDDGHVRRKRLRKKHIGARFVKKDSKERAEEADEDYDEHGKERRGVRKAVGAAAHRFGKKDHRTHKTEDDEEHDEEDENGRERGRVRKVVAARFAKKDSKSTRAEDEEEAEEGKGGKEARKKLKLPNKFSKKPSLDEEEAAKESDEEEQEDGYEPDTPMGAQKRPVRSSNGKIQDRLVDHINKSGKLDDDTEAINEDSEEEGEEEEREAVAQDVERKRLIDKAAGRFHRKESKEAAGGAGEAQSHGAAGKGGADKNKKHGRLNRNMTTAKGGMNIGADVEEAHGGKILKRIPLISRKEKKDMRQKMIQTYAVMNDFDRNKFMANLVRKRESLAGQIDVIDDIIKECLETEGMDDGEHSADGIEEGGFHSASGMSEASPHDHTPKINTAMTAPQLAAAN